MSCCVLRHELQPLRCSGSRFVPFRFALVCVVGSLLASRLVAAANNNNNNSDSDSDNQAKTLAAEGSFIIQMCELSFARGEGWRTTLLGAPPEPIVTVGLSCDAEPMPFGSRRGANGVLKNALIHAATIIQSLIARPPANSFALSYLPRLTRAGAKVSTRYSRCESQAESCLLCQQRQHWLAKPAPN